MVADPSRTVSARALPPQAWDTAFEPYAQAVGFMLREWNHLQESFASLFEELVTKSRPGLGRAIWYAIPNDRIQRKMLLAAAHQLLSPLAVPRKLWTKKEKINAKLLAEIVWAVESADALGARRDAAAHSPVALILDEPLEFVPADFWGNPLAKSFKGKKLLDEIELYRKRAFVISGHVTWLTWFARQKSRTTAAFPQRPDWPDRPHQATGAKSSPKARAK